MKIAVNTRLLLNGKLEGIGWFACETLKRITRDHPGHTFLFIFDRPFDESFIFGENVQGIVVPPPARHPLLWYAWYEFSLPRAIAKHRADLFFSPDGYMPLNLKIPTLIAIHDINFHHRPQDLPCASRIYYNRYFPRFALKADRIVTVSEFSKKDIADNYHVEQDKIDVVYNGVNETYSPIPPDIARQTRQSLTGGVPYFIFVGSMHPRKNIGRLLLAFDRFKKTHPRPFKLVIIGGKMFKTAGVDRIYRNMNHGSDVVFNERLQPDKLRNVLGASAGLTFVSLYEGFGIPLLEAMRCDVPILASNVTSMPEVAGKAALYTDPTNVSSIAEGMRLLATDKELRNKLVALGRTRSSDFSWDLTAGRLWSSLQSIMPED